VTEDTYSKVVQIADELLGKEGMHKYPFLLVIGLLCIAFALRKHRAAEPLNSEFRNLPLDSAS
jgi:hypothetical protein